MTELDIMRRAKMYMDKLSQGIDPISGQAMPGDTALNQERLAKCFSYVSGVLQREIDRQVARENQPQKSFLLTPEVLRRVALPDHSLRLSEFADLLQTAAGDPDRKRPNVRAISDWLLEKGFLAKETSSEGKTSRVPTEAGKQIGIYTELYQGKYGMYQMVCYTPQAQRFLLDHLAEMFPPSL